MATEEKKKEQDSTEEIKYDKTLNIYQRLLNSQEELKKIEKKISGASSGANHNEVTQASKDAFTANGVLCFPTVLETTYADYETEKADGAIRVDTECTTRIKVLFINVDNPKECLISRSSGQGLDTSDKAFGKAYSQAFKFCLLKVLMANVAGIDETDQSQKRQPMNFNTRAQGRDITPIEPLQQNKTSEQKNQEAIDRQVGFMKTAATSRRLDEVWAFSQRLFNGATAAQQESLSNAYILKQQELREEGK